MQQDYRNSAQDNLENDSETSPQDEMIDENDEEFTDDDEIDPENMSLFSWIEVLANPDLYPEGLEEQIPDWARKALDELKEINPKEAEDE